MRTVVGFLVVAAVSLVAHPPARADGFIGWLAEGKDALAKGDWDGEESWDPKPSGGGLQPAAGNPTLPPGTGGGGTPTPPPEAGGGGSTAGGDDGTTPGGGDPGDGEPPVGSPTPGGGGTPVPPPGGTPPPTPTPTPPPAPLPSCAGRFVLDEVKVQPELYDKETLLTIILFRNDAFAFIANGYCRSESTWYVDWFATTSAEYGTQKEYQVEIRLEGACPNCAPCYDLDGASNLEAKAKARTSWGSLCSRSSAKAMASTVWSGDLSASDDCEASVSNLLTGSETKLEVAGISISDKGTRSEAGETATAGKGDQKTKNQASTRVAITNKGSVETHAADVENNCQAKSRAGQRMKIKGKTKCGAEATFELIVVAR